LDHHGGPVDRGLSQREVGKIQVEYVKEEIGKDENYADYVNRPPEKGIGVESPRTQHGHASPLYQMLSASIDIGASLKNAIYPSK